MDNTSRDGEKNVEIIPHGSVETGYIRLPYGADEFKDFIKSLLGSPQSFSKEIKGAFEFTTEDVRNLHSLLIQRISQQNQGVLAKFEAQITFSDDSTVLLNSIEEVKAW